MKEKRRGRRLLLPSGADADADADDDGMNKLICVKGELLI